MADKKYLVVYKGFATCVPKSLQDFVKKTVVDEFSKFDLELDFTGKQASHDLLVTFSREIPIWPVFGESSRPFFDNDLNNVLSGDSTIFVGAMQAMRIQTGDKSCEAAFPESEAALGSLIANTTIHETAHMLGLNVGGQDDGGHTTDLDNYMWGATTLPGGSTRVTPVFEYTVKRGDTLSGLLQRYLRGALDPCRIGPTDLTYSMVWEHDANKQAGFIRDPKKGGVSGRRTDNPNWIYPGEKVAFPNHNLRIRAYRRNFPGFLGKKSFTTQQVDAMKKFIAQRLAAGKG
jgi:hypothetical protein